MIEASENPCDLHDYNIVSITETEENMRKFEGKKSWLDSSSTLAQWGMCAVIEGPPSKPFSTFSTHCIHNIGSMSPSSSRVESN